MSEPSQHQRSKSQQRRLSLQKLLSSTDITHTKNNIRTIIDAYTQNYYTQPYKSSIRHNYIYNNNNNSQLAQSRIFNHNNKQITSQKTNLNNSNNSYSFSHHQQQQPQIQTQNKQYQSNKALITITQPLQKLSLAQGNILQQINSIKRQLSNLHKPKTQEITLQNKQFGTWQQWMGRVFGEVFERAFELFSTQKITYDQMRAFCCQKILVNLIQFDQQLTSKDNLKHSLFSSQNQSTIHNNSYRSQQFQQGCHLWQIQAQKIMEHQCNKYPQVTQKLQVNKKLQQIVKRNQIDNFQNDDYDFIEKTGLVFQYKHTGDYTEEIMMFLNQVISISERVVRLEKNQEKEKGNGKDNGINKCNGNWNTNPNEIKDKTKNNTNINTNNHNQTLFNNFHTFFTNTFRLVNHRNRSIDMNVLLHQRLNDTEYCKFRFSEEQDIQYFQKVQSYTKVQIGTKIPLNSQTYPFDEIVSGNVEIKSKQVCRVVEKWIEQLRGKLMHPQKHIFQRIHRFKSNTKNQRIKLSQKQKQLLVNKLTQQRQSILIFQQKLIQNIEQISDQLMSQLGNLSDLTFLDQTQRAMGEFACKMEQASVEYSVQQLNQVIGGLLKAVHRMKQQQIKLNDSNSQFIDKQIKLNLITFKLGDLLRCKFTSHEEQVIRIFQFLITMSQMSYLHGIFKIIRIKNRLHLSTKDILINALFKQSIVCEVQLSVNSNVSAKQKLMDKFNHFLYQLKRSQMGVLLQLCNVWVNNCPKSVTFKKYIKQQNVSKKSLRQNICRNVIFEMNNTNHVIHRLPFICNLCKIFYTRQQTVFKTVKFQKYPRPICGECMSQRVSKDQRLKYLFSSQDKPAHIVNYLQKFKLHESVIQIFTLSQINSHEFMIMIPINSRKINKFTIHKIDTTQITYLVNNQLLQNGKLQMKVMYEFFNRDESIQQQQKKFFNKYCLFTFNRPVEMRPIEIKKTNFNGILQKDLKKIHLYNNNPANSENKLHCLYMKLTQTQYVLFPHYCDQFTDPRKKLKQNLIIGKITTSVKNFKQVIQLSSSGLTDEFTKIPQGIRIKINSIVHEIYIDGNGLTQIDWVSDVHVLEILSARNNNIGNISAMPSNVKFVDLAYNKITKIEGFGDNENERQNNPLQIQQKESVVIYHKLRVLILDNNYISKIQGLKQTINIRELSLSHNTISVIENISHLQKLRRLNLSFNPITKIDNLSQLQSIEHLSLGNTLVNSTRGIDDLDGLETLVIDNAMLGESVNATSVVLNDQLGSTIGKMNNIKKTESTQIIPITITQQQQTTSRVTDTNILSVSRLQSQSLQSSLSYLPKNIKNLNLSNNYIQSLQDINQLQHLQQLILHTNTIATITLTQSLSNIKLLNLSHNRIQMIPDMKQIVQLKQLYLSYNLITQVQGLEQSLFLSVLDLSHNKIRQLKNIKYLINLNKLSAHHNMIQSIQPFDNLKTLKQLQLANNLITEILFTLPLGLRRVNLQNNKLQSLSFISNIARLKRDKLNQPQVASSSGGSSSSITVNTMNIDQIQQINIKNNNIPLPMLLSIKSLLHLDTVDIIA